MALAVLAAGSWGVIPKKQNKVSGEIVASIRDQYGRIAIETVARFASPPYVSKTPTSTRPSLFTCT